MARMSKLQRSQRAHRRLRDKYSQKVGKVARDKVFYHNYCLDRQNRIDRVLTQNERKSIWNSFVN